MNFVEAMTAAQAGFDTWAAKPHNAKWAKMVYRTPIPKDLLVNIAEAFCAASVTAVVTPRPFYIITWDGQTHSNFTVVYNDEDKAVQS